MVHPRSSITCGGSVAAIQWATVPFSSVTSKKIWLWGLVHSNFVIVPFITTALEMSYTLAAPWCARTGAGGGEKDDGDRDEDSDLFVILLFTLSF